MPLSPLAHGPTAAAPPDVLARLPRSSGGEPVAMGAWAMEGDPDADTERLLVIDIDGFIGWWGTSASEFKRTVKRHAPTSITLRIASPGGFVADALAIHDFLLDYARDHDCPVTSLVHGLTASSATVIACAASKKSHEGSSVRMSANALFLVHKPWGLCVGTDADMAVAAREYQKFNRVFEGLYARKTGLDKTEVAEHIGANNGAGEWWDAETALELGYVDEVYEPGSADGGDDGTQARASTAGGAAALSAHAKALASIPKALADGMVAASLHLPPLPAAAAATAASAATAATAAPDEEAAPPGSSTDTASAADPEALAALQERLDGLHALLSPDAP